MSDCDRLKRALVWWDCDHSARSYDEVRDEIVGILERNYHHERPYPAVDRVMQLLGASVDEMDQTLYRVIPEDHWGIQIPDGQGFTMEQFVDGEIQ